MRLRILLAVTHLLGAGHLTRTAALARALARAGHRATLVSGGTPTAVGAGENLDFVQLPPVRTAGTNFTTLLDPDGVPVDPARLAARRERLLETLRSTRPHVVVTELFPFGRRVLADEYLDLIHAARALPQRPLMACSVRDILVAPTKAGRVEEVHDRLAAFYDLVLVHGDPSLVPLDESWPVSDRIRPLLRYTGYVDEGAGPASSATARAEILVSGGSSAASLPLYAAALAAARAIPDHPWRILIGNGVPEAAFRSLVDAAPAHAIVERARPDFRRLLQEAAISVSQAGYNTVVDLLRTKAPAVLVPFEAGRETEQRLRAERLEAHGLARLVPEADLSADRLVAAIRSALSMPPPPDSPAVALDGAERSVRTLEECHRGFMRRRQAVDWRPFAEALRRVRDEGSDPVFWWRDDDAVDDSPALRRLLRLASGSHSPLALAVIPRGLRPTLAPILADEARVSVLVHGYAHTNHAPAGEKKAEFGAQRSLAESRSEAASGLAALQAVFGSRVLPVFVPPWNRVAPDLVPGLVDAGFRGLSTFGPRKAAAGVPALLQVNTHIDPIDWHGSRSLVDPDRLVAAAAKSLALREPIGFLTHHLVHDEAVWSFCEAFIEQLARNNVRLALAGPLFSVNNRIVPQT